MESQTLNQDWRKGPARHLLRLIQESFQLLDAYASDDKNGKVLVPDIYTGKIIQIRQSPPNHDEVLQTYVATDEYFSQLGSFVNSGEIPRKDFNRLFYQYNMFIRLSKNKWQMEFEEKL